eukprot:scaffold30420_cov55-Cyclotella_meneghiniana.AAC.2
MSARSGSVPVIKSNNPSVGVVRWMGSSEARMNSITAVMIWDMVSFTVSYCCLVEKSSAIGWWPSRRYLLGRNDTAEIKLNSHNLTTSHDNAHDSSRPLTTPHDIS